MPSLVFEPRHEKTCLCHMRTSAQSDQRLCCSLPCYSQNFKTRASLCGLAGRFGSYLVANPEDRFSRGVAQFCVPFPFGALGTLWKSIV